MSPRFFHQSWLLKIFHNTGCGTNRFFGFRFEIQIYRENSISKRSKSMNLYWIKLIYFS